MGRTGIHQAIFACAALAFANVGRAQTTAPRYRADAHVAEGSRATVSLLADLPLPASSLRLTGGPWVVVDSVLAPRFWLGRGFQLRAAFALTAFLTNADTTRGTDVYASDVSTALWFHGAPRFGDFYPAFSAGLRFPTSEASRARTMVVGTDLGAQLVWWRGAEELTWFARGSLAWAHDFMQYTSTPVRTSPFPLCTSATGGDCSATPTLFTAGAVSWSLLFAPRWNWISPGITYGMSHAYVVGDGRAPSVASLTSTRFAAWVEFIPHAVFSVMLSYAVSRALVDARGNVNNPLGSDTYPGTVGLTLALRLDAIVDAARGRSAGPGGNVWW